MAGFSGTSAHVVLSLQQEFDSRFRFLQSRLIDTDIAQDVRQTIIFYCGISYAETRTAQSLHPSYSIRQWVFGDRQSHIHADINNQHLMFALAISMGTGFSYVSSAGGHGTVRVHGTSAGA